MTNKVKPFYIRITDDMTPQMVQDAFDKCVDAGADVGDCVDEAKSKHEYQEFYEFGEYELFGVAGSGITRFYDAEAWFGSDAQEITLDQLDEWLGLKSKAEWNGEGLPPVGLECEMKCKHSSSPYWRAAKVFAYDGSIAAIWHFDNEWKHATIDTQSYQFRKPETPEQKAEREKRDEAEEMIQCLLDNYATCEDSAINYVIGYLKECERLGK